MINNIIFSSTFSLLLLISLSGFSQKFEEVFTHSHGSTDWQGISDLKVHGKYMYMVGSYGGTLTIDTLTIIETDTIENGYFAKLDTLGNLIWLKRYDKAPLGRIALDTNDNIFILGIFNDTVYFDSTNYLTEFNVLSKEMFLLKLNSNGDFLWATQFVGTFTFQLPVISGPLLVVAKNQSVQVYTGYMGSISYDTLNLVGRNNSASIIYNINSLNGNLNWTRYLGHSSNLSIIRPYKMVVDNEGNTIVCGTYKNQINTLGGSVTGASQYERGYVAKFNALGNLIFLKSSFTSSANFNSRSYFRDVTIDDNNNIYIIGHFDGEVRFDAFTANGFGSNYNPNFILKLNPLGVALNLKAYLQTTSSQSVASFNGIEIGKINAIYITGIHHGSAVKFDSLTVVDSTLSGNNILFLKLDSNLTAEWATSGEGNGFNTGIDIEISSQKQPYFFGKTNQPIKFADKTINSTFGSYVAKMGDCSIDTVINNARLCPGENYVFGNRTLTTSGAYFKTIKKDDGCDSVYMVQLTFFDPVDTIFQISACDSYLWSHDNLSYNSTGIYRDTLIDFNGCDSIVILDLTILSNYEVESLVACDSFVWINGATYYSSTNLPRDTLKNQFNCDSIVQLNLIVQYSNYTNETIVTCDSLTWINGVTYYSSTSNVFDTLLNSYGCDSIVHLDLTVNISSTTITSIVQCQPYTWLHNNQTYFNSGVYVDSLVGSARCDSIQILDLDVQSNGSVDNLVACDSLVWINGITYYSSTNLPKDTLKNQFNCDSIIELNLVVNYSNRTIETIVVCDSLTWSNGIKYFSSTNLPLDTFPNFLGCDSIVELNVTILKSDTVHLPIITCDSLVSPSGKFIWKTSGLYSDTVSNSGGCDSIILISLTVNQSYSSYEIRSICDGDSSSIFGVYEKTAGRYVDSLINKEGCDSISTIDLIVNPIIRNSFTVIICDGDSTLIHGNYQTSSGVYVDSSLSTKGCDSITSVTLIRGNAYSLNQSLSICQGESVTVNGIVRNTAGTFIDTLQTIYGCDSIYSTVISVLPIFNSQVTSSICLGDSILIYNNYQRYPGTYFDSLQSVSGCDSILSTLLTVYPSYYFSRSQTICNGDSLLIFGQYRKVAGIYFDSLQTINGCDSIFLFNLNISSVNTTVIDNSPLLIANATNANYQWLNCNAGYASIPGATNQNYIATVIGNYSVEITKGGCVDTSVCIPVTVVGIDENRAAKFNFEVCPNPAANYFRITVPVTELDETLTIYSSDGSIAKQIQVQQTNQIINISGMANGLYFIRYKRHIERIVLSR
jgi:hypothetical protein